jgi:hypothetical protein
MRFFHEAFLDFRLNSSRTAYSSKTRLQEVMVSAGKSVSSLIYFSHPRPPALIPPLNGPHCRPLMSLGRFATKWVTSTAICGDRKRISPKSATKLSIIFPLIQTFSGLAWWRKPVPLDPNLDISGRHIPLASSKILEPGSTFWPRRPVRGREGRS